ncbi:hypothetical protein KR044_003176 [Drosophila immigrans]|nr:hypothetical protein KR044_003176 [Drosophila immigrans]
MAPLRSGVWKYFSKNDESNVQCNICYKVLKCSNNTTNMMQHLKLKHGKEAEALKQSEKPKVKEEDQSQANQQLVGIMDKYFSIPKPGRTILPFWGELLNELPPDVARDAEVEITNLLHSKIKLHARKKH